MCTKNNRQRAGCTAKAEARASAPVSSIADSSRHKAVSDVLRAKRRQKEPMNDDPICKSSDETKLSLNCWSYARVSEAHGFLKES